MPLVPNGVGQNRWCFPIFGCLVHQLHFAHYGLFITPQHDSGVQSIHRKSESRAPTHPGRVTCTKHRPKLNAVLCLVPDVACALLIRAMAQQHDLGSGCVRRPVQPLRLGIAVPNAETAAATRGQPERSANVEVHDKGRRAQERQQAGPVNNTAESQKASKTSSERAACQYLCWPCKSTGLPCSDGVGGGAGGFPSLWTTQ